MSTIKLVPEIKEKWLTALRSGDYKKGIAALRNPDSDSYCCLGVLCDMYNKEKGENLELDGKLFPEDKVMEWAFGVSVHEIASRSEGYSQPIVNSRGVRLNNGIHNETVLTEINDDAVYQKDFEEIAKIIEEQL